MKQNVAGSTSDIAELEIDYKKGTSEIRDVPPETAKNRVMTALGEWMTFLLYIFVAPLVIAIVLGDTWSWGVNYVGSVFIISWCLISLCHINKRWDKKWKKYFALRSGNGSKNKAVFSDLKSKKFVLYGFKNIALDYKATGDVGRQLNKIWVKNEHEISKFKNGSVVDEFKLLDNKNIWNAYFYFDEIPKDGQLILEWI